MNDPKPGCAANQERRSFLKLAGATALGASLAPLSAAAQKQQFAQQRLQVWSCGGLAEALIPATQAYEKISGAQIAYTGAFAAALGKSLLASATTDVFAGRVLKLAQKLRQVDKMLYFKPLCFTEYVLMTPKGNPAGIRSIHDLGRPGV
ncbi:MAG: substrate-binding domain-containing protein, partial [Deltaproteobacteria bacterium]|nr:substrate-binding domain-containing protein [Deltaproteobacteria bacterium]